MHNVRPQRLIENIVSFPIHYIFGVWLTHFDFRAPLFGLNSIHSSQCLKIVFFGLILHIGIFWVCQCVNKPRCNYPMCTIIHTECVVYPFSAPSIELTKHSTNQTSNANLTRNHRTIQHISCAAQILRKYHDVWQWAIHTGPLYDWSLGQFCEKFAYTFVGLCGLQKPNKFTPVKIQLSCSTSSLVCVFDTMN